MMTVEIVDAKLQAWGNSYGVRIPKRLAEKAGLTKGDVLTLSLRKKHDVQSMFGKYKGLGPFQRERGLLDRF